MSIPRPECAGWHAPDPICDGGPGEPPCAYRERCLRILDLVGGAAKRDAMHEASLAAQVEAIPESDLDPEPELPPVVPEPPAPPVRPEAARKASGRASTSRVSPAAATEPPGAPTPLPAPVTPADPAPLPPIHSGPVRTAMMLYPRPEAKFGHVLPLLDALAARLAGELRRRLMREGDPDTRPGDLFWRWTPGMNGRSATLYEATHHGNRRHRVLARAVMHRRTATYNLKTNIPDHHFAASVDLRPPRGPACKVWQDVKAHVALLGVDATYTVDAARWLARCYHNGLVDEVKRPGPAPGTPRPRRQA